MTSRLGALRSVVASVLVDAYMSLTARPVRTSAMIAGIVLGVASATAAVIIADTQQAQIDKRFDAQRSQFVVLQANGDTSGGFPAAQAARIRALEPVSAAGEMSIWRESVPVAAGPLSPTRLVPLIGGTASGLAAAQARTVSGIAIASLDGLRDRSVVWLGARLAGQLGVRMDLPETVLVAGRPYTVAGIVQTDSGFGYLNSSVVMSSALAYQHYGPGKTVRFLAHTRPGSASALAEYGLAALDPTRKLSLANATEPDGKVLLGNVAGDLRRIGLALGAFVGLVGMVAVANTLSMSVNQRSRELGLRAAMGWTRRRIASLVLVESAIAGLIAAVIGSGTGVLVSLIWCRLQDWELILAPGLAPFMVAAGTLSSLVGGLLPAFRAASVSPLEAMRA